jgi:hypothetical protein
MGATHISLERLLQIVLAGMMVLATMLFGAGHRARLLIWCVIILAVAAIYLVDVTRRFQLKRGWANLFSVTAVAIWLAESMVLVGEMQLIAVTYVLLFLQLILMFQAKGQRVYWQLIVLSVAQAAVASALAPGLLFAILLVAYVVLGVLALCMLLMLRELARFDRSAPALAAASAPALSVYDPVAPAERAPAWRSASAARPALQFVGGAAPLPEESFRRTLAAQTTAIVLGTLVSTGLVFVFFPRVEREREGFDDEVRSVGFSKEVTLGEQAGEAQLNPDTVMRVQLFEEPGGQPFQLEGEPLFRGSVATHYSRGKWRQSRSMSTRSLELIRTDRYVRQHITIEKLEDSTLFSMAPAFRIDDDERLRIDYAGDQIVRPHSARSQRMEFDLATTGVRGRKQAEILAWGDNSLSSRDTDLLQPFDSDDGEAESLAGVRAAAERVKLTAQVADGDRIGLARALEHYLRDSGDFQYTLEGQKRNLKLDPIEDFVVEHRRGHCEYFAGALALMLRSQGIPARVAIGFRAGEWNSAGGYYQVRQLHAHAWVEALLEPKHYLDQDLGTSMRWQTGAWLVLDPTPAGVGAATGGLNSGLWSRAGMYLDYLQVLWGKYVATLDARAQQEEIYAPIGRLLVAVFGDIFSFEVWRERLASAIEAIVVPWRWYRQHWFSLPGALCTLLILLIVAGLSRGAGPMTRWWRARPASRRLAPGLAGRSQNELYCRLERALARRGLVRLAGQTPYEFALAAGGELAESVDHIPLASLPRRVVEAFYRVRFGARPLDNSEVKAVEQALRVLEEKL